MNIHHHIITLCAGISLCCAQTGHTQYPYGGGVTDSDEMSQITTGISSEIGTLTNTQPAPTDSGSSDASEMYTITTELRT